MIGKSRAKLKFTRLLSLTGIFLLTGLFSCSEDLVVHLDKPIDKPIIYFLLNPNDSVQYLRIQKAYLGVEDALETAKNKDSIYAYGSTALLERIEKGNVMEQFTMEPIQDYPKDSGIFSTDGHIIYRMNGKILTGSTYRLTVDVPELGKPIYAETTPYSQLEVISVNRWPNGINMVNAKFARVSWVSLPNTETYQLNIRFNYFDITASDTIPRFIDWKIPRVTSRTTEGGEIMDLSIPINQWFLLLGDKIPISDEIIKRVAGRFDYTWHFAGEPLETYMTQDQTQRNGLLSDYPQYSNIQNAIGIFSYRSSHEVKGYSISLYTLERITTHPSTKYLKFDGRQYW